MKMSSTISKKMKEIGGVCPNLIAMMFPEFPPLKKNQVYISMGGLNEKKTDWDASQFSIQMCAKSNDTKYSDFEVYSPNYDGFLSFMLHCLNRAEERPDGAPKCAMAIFDLDTEMLVTAGFCFVPWIKVEPHSFTEVKISFGSEDMYPRIYVKPTGGFDKDDEEIPRRAYMMTFSNHPTIQLKWCDFIFKHKCRMYNKERDSLIGKSFWVNDYYSPIHTPLDQDDDQDIMYCDYTKTSIWMPSCRKMLYSYILAEGQGEPIDCVFLPFYGQKVICGGTRFFWNEKERDEHIASLMYGDELCGVCKNAERIPHICANTCRTCLEKQNHNDELVAKMSAELAEERKRKTEANKTKAKPFKPPPLNLPKKPTAWKCPSSQCVYQPTALALKNWADKCAQLTADYNKKYNL